MTKLALGVVVVVAALAACFTSRRSDAFECTGTTDCDGSRVCVSGYCVARDGAACPAACTSCDLNAMTCRIECSGTKACAPAACPAGFACTIKCSGTGACPSVDCAAGQRCDVTCTGTAACGQISCGKPRCDVSCSGTSACGAVNCASSCRCDMSCTGSLACPTPQCPTVDAMSCTTTGAPGQPCDSGFDPSCDRC
jgi:hypothetical protein